ERDGLQKPANGSVGWNGLGIRGRCWPAAFLPDEGFEILALGREMLPITFRIDKCLHALCGGTRPLGVKREEAGVPGEKDVGLKGIEKVQRASVVVGDAWIGWIADQSCARV